MCHHFELLSLVFATIRTTCVRHFQTQGTTFILSDSNSGGLFYPAGGSLTLVCSRNHFHCKNIVNARLVFRQYEIFQTAATQGNKVSHIVYVQYDRLVQKEYDISSNSESIKV
jgi:hypothetical protein